MSSRLSVPCALLLLLVCNATTADFTWVNRPDPMRVHRLYDFDVAAERVRVLYASMPDLQQSARDDWTVNVYVAELFPDGRIENRSLITGQRHFTSLVLQRGGDKVFVVPGTAHGERSETMEIWSAADGELLNSFSSPSLAGIGGSALPVFPTDDGNFFVVQHSAQSGRGGEPTTLTWFKFSPAGELLAKGQWSNPTAVTGLGGAFSPPGGGMGFVLNLRLADGAHALKTDIEAVQPFEIGGRKIEARVFAETRLLATDASGAVLWTSPALERELLWDGEMAIPQGLPMSEMMAQNAEQMALMRDVNLESGGDRMILHQSTTQYDDIKQGRQGYGMLTSVAADQSLDPPVHGTWFIEVGRDGSLGRELRIEPIAEQLGGKLERFLPTSDGGLLVAGPRYEGETHIHLSAIDKDGRGLWTVQVGAKGLQLEGLAGTAEVPWVFGQGWSEAHGKSLLWVERVDPNSAQPLEAAASAAAPASQTRPKPDPQAAALPSFEMPETPEGCECSCEELATFEARLEQMKSLPQAEMIAMIQDPAYVDMMNCMGGCAMQYAQCR